MSPTLRPSIAAIARRQFSHTTRVQAHVGLEALNTAKGDRERIVILGSGWAGYTLAQRLSPRYQTLVISPRSHFVFTPLLNSTSVGTLEFRTALEPVRSKRKPNIEFIQGWGDDVDFARKTLTVEESVVDAKQARADVEAPYYDHSKGEASVERQHKRKEGNRFEISYDKLVVTVGCYSQTFGTKGVKENAYFMKDVGDARRVRKRILECFEIAALPTTSEALRQQLLRFAIVGGGPTGMEFAAELSDLVREDLTKLYPELVPKVNIRVLDVAPKVLSMFDEKLGKYAMETFQREGVEIRTSRHVEELRAGLPRTDGEDMSELEDSQGCYTLRTKEDGEVGIGMCVWSTGNMMNPFVQKATAKHFRFPESATSEGEKPLSSQASIRDGTWMIEKDAKTGGIVVNDQLQVQIVSKNATPAKDGEGEEQGNPVETATVPDVFALGDNASIRNATLPATAQTASQEAMWLAKRFNKGDLDSQHFSFRNLGIMTYLGSAKALVQTPVEGVFGDISGRVAFLIWRGAYLTMSVSWRNKILIPTYWFLNWVFGRDITRF